jgi:hypothetical protein
MAAPHMTFDPSVVLPQVPSTEDNLPNQFDFSVFGSNEPSLQNLAHIPIGHPLTNYFTYPRALAANWQAHSIVTANRHYI